MGDEDVEEYEVRGDKAFSNGDERMYCQEDEPAPGRRSDESWQHFRNPRSWKLRFL